LSSGSIYTDLHTDLLCQELGLAPASKGILTILLEERKKLLEEVGVSDIELEIRMAAKNACWRRRGKTSP